MKFTPLLFFLLATTIFGQEIVKINSKYGIEQYAFRTEGLSQVPAEYDSIVFMETNTFKGFICYKMDATDLFEIDDNYVIRELKSKEANQFYFAENDDYGIDFMATNSAGDYFMYDPDSRTFEKSEYNAVLICRTDDGMALFKNQKPISKSYPLITTSNNSVYIAKTSSGYNFLNQKGKELLEESAIRYETNWKTPHLIHIWNKNGMGLINTEKNVVVPFCSSVSPARFINQSEWSSNMQYVDTDQIPFEKKGKIGLKNFAGNKIFEAKFDDIKITAELTFAKLNNQWTAISIEGELLEKIHFHEFIALGEGFICVRRNDSTLYFDLKTDLFAPIEQLFADQPFKIVQSPNSGKVGVIGANGELKIPMIYEDYIVKESVIALKSVEGYTAYDKNFRPISQGTFDEFWVYEKSTDYFVYRKGVQYGIFKSDNSYHFGPEHFFDPYSSFHIDIEAHTAWKEEYVLIRDNKVGAVGASNKTIIPFKYDKVLMGRSTSQKILYAGIKNNTLTLYNQDLSSSLSLKNESLIDFPNFHDQNAFIIANDEQVYLVDAENLTTQKTDVFSKKIERVTAYYGDWRRNKNALCNKDGKLIYGFELNSISTYEVEGETDFAIITLKDRTQNIVLENGETLFDKSVNHIYCICSKTPKYLAISNDNKEYALAKIEGGKIIYLSDFEFKYCSCARREAYDIELTYTDDTKAQFNFEDEKIVTIKD